MHTVIGVYIPNLCLCLHKHQHLHHEVSNRTTASLPIFYYCVQHSTCPDDEKPAAHHVVVKRQQQGERLAREGLSLISLLQPDKEEK